ncbi:MAG: hypothetical protein WA990_00610 [Rubrobacteraceae bacterium]
MTRERFALVSYLFLLTLFVGDFALILLFPGSAAYFSVWFGPIFAVLGAQLVYFRNEHARIWADWGGPQARAFAFVGVFFLMIGLYFAFGASLG